MLAVREAKILDVENSLNKKQAFLQQLKQKQHKLEQEKGMNFLSFYVKYQRKKDPVTGIKVSAINMDDKVVTPEANYIFGGRQKRITKIQRRLATAIGEEQEGINHLQSVLQKEKEEIAAMQETLQKFQRQLSLLLKKRRKWKPQVLLSMILYHQSLSLTRA